MCSARWIRFDSSSVVENGCPCPVLQSTWRYTPMSRDVLLYVSCSATGIQDAIRNQSNPIPTAGRCLGSSVRDQAAHGGVLLKRYPGSSSGPGLARTLAEQTPAHDREADATLEGYPRPTCGRQRSRRTAPLRRERYTIEVCPLASPARRSDGQTTAWRPSDTFWTSRNRVRVNVVPSTRV